MMKPSSYDLIDPCVDGSVFADAADAVGGVMGLLVEAAFCVDDLRKALSSYIDTLRIIQSNVVLAKEIDDQERVSTIIHEAELLLEDGNVGDRVLEERNISLCKCIIAYMTSIRSSLMEKHAPMFVDEVSRRVLEAQNAARVRTDLANRYKALIKNGVVAGNGKSLDDMMRMGYGIYQREDGKQIFCIKDGRGEVVTSVPYYTIESVHKVFGRKENLEDFLKIIAQEEDFLRALYEGI